MTTLDRWEKLALIGICLSVIGILTASIILTAIFTGVIK